MSKVYVFGGANIDIVGLASRDLVLNDSNIGSIKYSFGGVARNIAENLARLEIPVNLVTIFSNDLFGKSLLEDCKRLNIETNFSKIIDEPSSTYLALLDKNQDLLWALADMNILDHLSKEMFDEVFQKMTVDDILVIDTNLPQELLKYAIKNSPVPVYLDPISTTKILKVENLLSSLTMIKPNLLEAETLSGLKFRDQEDYQAILDYFLINGVKETVISLGSKGVLIATKQEKAWFQHQPLEMINATGAGDSFLAGYLAMTVLNKTIDEKISFAIGCAAKTIRSESTVSKSLNQSDVLASLEDLAIKKIIL